MKKIVAVILVCTMLSMALSACGSSMNINGKEYDTVGLLNENNPKIEYKPIWENIIWVCFWWNQSLQPFISSSVPIWNMSGLKAPTLPISVQ